METLLKGENYFSYIIFMENIQLTPLEESCDSFLNNPSSEIIISIDDTIIFFISECFGLFILPQKKQSMILLMMNYHS
jgi:hypothetical protein